MNLFECALEILFPTTCGICDKICKNSICDNCYKEIEKYLYDKNSGKDNFFLLKYEGIIRKKMIEYKFEDKAYLYSMFCEIFVKNKNACEFIKEYDIIIPVPIHKKRKRIRGYNQSELIARKLAKEFKLEMYVDVLKKVIHTLPQSSLNKNERAKNIQNVYKIENIGKIVNKKVLILDDIYTTGATVNECRKILKFSGAARVGVMTIAKD